MKTRNLVLIIIGVFLLFLGGCGCNSYNGLVNGDQNVKQSLGNIETNYQRRADLYSSVVKTIQGAGNFEKSTLTAVLEARSKATSIQLNADDPASLEKFQQAQEQLKGSFSRLMAVAEAYPNLKTNDQFMGFQAQIEGTENRINIARRDYNEAVNAYNLKVRRFPNNIFAGFFGFSEKAYYKSDPGSEKNPDFDFNFK
jgi:LemA protein